MAEFNIINCNKIRTSSYMAGPYKINIAKLSNDNTTIQYGDNKCKLYMYGENINLNSNVTIGLYSNNVATIRSYNSNVDVTSNNNVNIKANNMIKLDGGVKITNTAVPMYGTEDPPLNAEIGQLYFKLIN